MMVWTVAKVWHRQINQSAFRQSGTTFRRCRTIESLLHLRFIYLFVVYFTKLSVASTVSIIVSRRAAAVMGCAGGRRLPMRQRYRTRGHDKKDILYYVTKSDSITCEWLGRDMKGSSHGPTQIMSWHFSAGTQQNHEKSVRMASVSVVESGTPEYKSKVLPLH